MSVEHDDELARREALDTHAVDHPASARGLRQDDDPRATTFGVG
jgi:hypothetical protein